VAVADHHEPTEKAAEAAPDQAMDAMAQEGKDTTAQGHEAHAEMPEMSAEDKAMMEAWMKAGTPGEQHARMAEAAGDWTASVKTWMGPGEPTVSTGTVKRAMILDGRVLTEHFEGDMMGTPFVGHGMFGYDNASGTYWSTWNDSMSTGVMVSRGKWDAEKNELVQEGTVTNAMTGEPMTLKTVSRHPAPGTEVFEMWEPKDGEMVRTMEITYTKK
jgi:hypothetical protein